MKLYTDDCSRYWDWSLDSEDPASSPIFDSTLGFGGNGNTGRPVPDHNAYCVDQDPFANLQTRYIGEQRHKGIHMVTNCLSRNFANHTSIAHFSGVALSAEHVTTLLSIDDYIGFLLAVEEGPHDAIPIGLGGDFKSMTAPSDPLFFLRHAQLDRLWWIWQNMRPERKYAYNGAASRSSNATASLDDVLFFKGLERDVTVSDIIDTQGDLLCYKYDRDSISVEL